MSRGNGYECNIVFYTVRAKGYKEGNWGNRVSSVRVSVCEGKGQLEGSWKGAEVQKEIEPRSRGLVIVRSRYQATIGEDTVGWKGLSVRSNNL
jgi:hypothetical protein